MILCFLLAFAVQVSVLSPAQTDRVVANCAPADAIRFLKDSNRNEKRLSCYDFLVKKYAEAISIDWRLLSAVIWHESGFNPHARSNMSAKGLMQLRDVTAEQYGYPDADLFDPETNLRIGTRLLHDLLEQFRREGLDWQEALRFSLASYNSGSGTLSERREEAMERGLDPCKWEDVAIVYNEYNTVTTAYIEGVEQSYQEYCQRF